MQKNKILIVSRKFWPDKTEINDICAGFLERGYRVDVLCGYPESLKKKQSVEEHNGIKIFRVRSAQTSENAPFQYFLGCITFPFFSLFKIFNLRRNRYDKIFIYQDGPLTCALGGLLIGRKPRRGRVLYSVNLWPRAIYGDLDIQSAVLKAFLKHLSAKYYAEADMIITTSEADCRYLADEMKIHENKIIYVGAMPVREFETEVKDDDLLEKFAGAFKAVFIGDADKFFEYKTIVNAAEYLADKNVRDVRFVIVGGGSFLPAFKAEAEKRRLDEYFFFEGEQEDKDIPKYICLADVLIASFSSSETDSISSRTVNYLAAGKPMVLAGPGEILRDLRKTGVFTCESEDFEGFAKNLLKVRSMNVEERQSLGKRAKEYQNERFNRAAALDEILARIFTLTS